MNISEKNVEKIIKVAHKEYENAASLYLHIIDHTRNFYNGIFNATIALLVGIFATTKLGIIKYTWWIFFSVIFYIVYIILYLVSFTILLIKDGNTLRKLIEFFKKAEMDFINTKNDLPRLINLINEKAPILEKIQNKKNLNCGSQDWIMWTLTTLFLIGTASLLFAFL